MLNTLRAGFLVIAGLLASCAAYDIHEEEGIHGEVEVEWWYHWGYLTDDAGGEWACFSSFFRLWKKGIPLTRYLLYDLTDMKTGERSYRSSVGEEFTAILRSVGLKPKIPPPHTPIPGAPLEKAGDPLKLTYGADTLEQVGRGAYRLRVGDVEVTLRALSEPMAVEGTGLTGITTPETMHYYTFPRLEAEGSVRGKKAKGLFWYDHQWGSSWVGPSMGWSWWGLQLDDGTNVNAYVLRDVKSGSILRAVCTHDWRVYPLEATPLAWWESRLKIRYPVAWALKAGPLDLNIAPFHEDRESIVLGEGETIWEGPVRVTGSAGGRGFQELVGYGREQKRPK
jgi:predicted secreted hydrolase